MRAQLLDAQVILGAAASVGRLAGCHLLLCQVHVRFKVHVAFEVIRYSVTVMKNLALNNVRSSRHIHMLHHASHYQETTAWQHKAMFNSARTACILRRRWTPVNS